MTKTICLLLPLSLLAAPSVAQEPLPVESRIVATVDLDLSSAEGMSTLNRRIDRAVAEVCGRAADVDLAGRNAVRACRAETTASAHIVRDRRIAGASREPILLAAR